MEKTVMYPRKTKKNIIILGSTGSLGCQVLASAVMPGSNYRIFALMGNDNLELLAKQCLDVNSEFAIVTNTKKRKKLAFFLRGGKTGILTYDEALVLVKSGVVDDVVHVLTGINGLRMAVEALKQNCRLIIGSKETLVAGVNLLKKTAGDDKNKIFPLDSELTALYIMMNGPASGQKIKSAIIPASGGPFLNKSKDEMSFIAPYQAILHPKWKMGKKISVDSATFVNKAFEIIIAHRFFDIPLEKIKTVVHPQALVHAIIETESGMLACKSRTDMKVMINTALNYPKIDSDINILGDIGDGAGLDFLQPDIERFPALSLGYIVPKMGESFPLAFSAADEIFVDAFLNSRISFHRISELLTAFLHAWVEMDVSTVDNIELVYMQAQKMAHQFI